MVTVGWGFGEVGEAPDLSSEPATVDASLAVSRVSAETDADCRSSFESAGGTVTGGSDCREVVEVSEMAFCPSVDETVGFVNVKVSLAVAEESAEGGTEGRSVGERGISASSGEGRDSALTSGVANASASSSVSSLFSTLIARSSAGEVCDVASAPSAVTVSSSVLDSAMLDKAGDRSSESLENALNRVGGFVATTVGSSGDVGECSSSADPVVDVVVMGVSVLLASPTCSPSDMADLNDYHSAAPSSNEVKLVERETRQQEGSARVDVVEVDRMWV